MSGIDHPDLEAALLKDLVKGDPVDARRFQSHRLDCASLEPICQLVKIRSKSFEASHRLWITISGHSHHMLFGSHVDSCRVGMDHGQTLQTHSLLGLIALRQSALVSFELRAWHAHQVTGPVLPQSLEIFFAHNAATKDPHPAGTAMFALHGLQQLRKEISKRLARRYHFGNLFFGIALSHREQSYGASKKVANRVLFHRARSSIL